MIITVRSVLLAIGLLAFALPALGATAPSPSGAPPGWALPVDDSKLHSLVLVDQLEYWNTDGEDALRWDVVSWFGGDYNRLWINVEGEDLAGSGGELERFDLLYGHLIAPFWDLQAGVGYQLIWGPGADPDRFNAVLGLQGLAPQWFEINTNLRLSEKGDLSADLEAEYDLLLTQRLVLQPRFETLVALQDVEEFGVGKGVNSVRLGARLRYELRREFAPYLGITWNRKLGDTANLARKDGEDIEDLSLVAGVRLWF